jgi:hypothetical protein
MFLISILGLLSFQLIKEPCQTFLIQAGFWKVSWRKRDRAGFMILRLVREYPQGFQAIVSQSLDRFGGVKIHAVFPTYHEPSFPDPGGTL